MTLCKKIDDIPIEIREKMDKDLTIKILPQKYIARRFNVKPKFVEIYKTDDDNVYIPLGYAINVLKFKKESRERYKEINLNFIGVLRNEQIIVKDEIIDHLNKSSTVLVSCFPGFGKTSVSIYIATKIKLKALIIINRLVLMKQWESSILKFCPDAEVSLITPANLKKYDIEDLFNSDFIIINAINVSKYPQKLYKDIGTVIIDEVHLILSTVLSSSLYMLTPRYLMGLSATPYRNDGLNQLFSFFFSDKIIDRPLHRPHEVFIVNTNFIPELEYSMEGDLKWDSVIESQCFSERRNKIIIDIVCKYRDRIFLLMTKRKEQAKYIYNEFIKLGEKAELYIESSQDYDKNSRILIGTVQKLGVGFDDVRLDALILCCDMESYFIQYLGRILRTEISEKLPVVFDLVDEDPTKGKSLHRHFQSRKDVYTKSGGIIKKYT